MPELARTSYDEVPYESHPYPQTHPDRLATVAKLLGLNPAMPDKCRVLELGCAGGGNLIPMAYGLPESQFLGVDLSRVQIDQGVETIKALGLKNIQPRHQSIVDIGPDIGKFDYIICHGVYSWVPTAVQDAILGVCYRHLLPRGIAYVSYNTYPGWHMRGMIRDMVSYHARQFAEPAMRVKQARYFLDFLNRAAVNDTGPYGLLLRGEVESIRQSSDSYLYHEHLEEINEPIYFHQFVDKAAKSKEPIVFETPAGLTLTSTDPIVKAAMVTLADLWPGVITFLELMREARAKLGRNEANEDPATDEQALGQALLGFYAQASTCLVSLCLRPPKFITKVSKRSLASPLARHQASTNNRVTNVRHESVFLGEFERQLIQLFDGEHERAQMVNAIQELVLKGDLTVEKDGQSLTGAQGLREVIAEAIERQSNIFARNGLLVG